MEEQDVVKSYIFSYVHMFNSKIQEEEAGMLKSSLDYIDTIMLANAHVENLSQNNNKQSKAKKKNNKQ